MVVRDYRVFTVESDIDLDITKAAIKKVKSLKNFKIQLIARIDLTMISITNLCLSFCVKIVEILEIFKIWKWM